MNKTESLILADSTQQLDALLRTFGADTLPDMARAIVAGVRDRLRQIDKPAAKPVKAPYVHALTPEQRASMTDAQFFAYCRKVAVHGDVEFFLAMSAFQTECRDDLVALRDELAGRKATPADVARLNRWKDASRTKNPAREFTFARERRLAEEQAAAEVAA